MLIWPMVALLGFVALNGVVIALGASATARYEFERNLAQSGGQLALFSDGVAVVERAPQAEAQAQAEAAAPSRRKMRGTSHSRVRRFRHRGRTTGQATESGARGLPPEDPRPATAQMGGQRTLLETRPEAGAAVAPGVQSRSTVGWWLVVESEDEPAESGTIVGGPFLDQVEADWAVLTSDLPVSVRTRVVHGRRRADGALVPQSSPEERAWVGELEQQLDRLSDDWDELITDGDALTTLVVEVAAALLEVGLPLYDGQAGTGSGGVCLTPAPEHRGVLATWRQHDWMSVQRTRGPEADMAVSQTMNAAVAHVLADMDFLVEPFGGTGCCLVTLEG
jgi:hypothetical protein